jgi:hypothetical protein
MTNDFLTLSNCDRCKSDLTIRKMSWFTEETICDTCSNLERDLRKKLPNKGRDLEGCGYLPQENKQN